MRKGMGGHQSSAPKTADWLTPKFIIDELGPFGLDPCAAPDPKPWATASHHYAITQNGLLLPWFSRVWLNPPTTSDISKWLERLADHGRGTALIFARTETAAFRKNVWDRAAACLFLTGRLHFCHPDGRQAKANAGAPSVLVAYGEEDTERLYESAMDGKFVPLNRAVMIHVALYKDQPLPGWHAIVTDTIRRLGGTATLRQLYQTLEGHAKAKANPHWRAKIRQTVARARLPSPAPATYSLAA